MATPDPPDLKSAPDAVSAVNRSFPFTPSTWPSRSLQATELGNIVSSSVSMPPDATPEQLEHEIRACGRALAPDVLKNTNDEPDREDDANAEAPAPAAPEDRGHLDLLDPDIRRARVLLGVQQ